MPNASSYSYTSEDRIKCAKFLRQLAKDMTEGDPTAAGKLIGAARMIERQNASPPGNGTTPTEREPSAAVPGKPGTEARHENAAPQGQGSDASALPGRPVAQDAQAPADAAFDADEYANLERKLAEALGEAKQWQTLAQATEALLVRREQSHGPSNGQWIACSERMPEDETPVLILRNGERLIGERRCERPTWEETFTAFRYWDDPMNDGQEWHDEEITYWHPLPECPSPATPNRHSEEK